MDKILITGGTGLIGTRLTDFLQEKEFSVIYLSRNASKHLSIPRYPWDPANGVLSAQELAGMKSIIHLAGQNIAERRWNHQQKKAILESRIRSTELLYKKLKTLPEQELPESFISASAIGFYGDRGEEPVDESSDAGNGFLSETAVRWEQEVRKIGSLGIRTVIIRTGIVMTMKGGALPVYLKPIRWFAGSALGSGSQYVSWIHLDDLCRIYLKAIEDSSLDGVYNGVAPHPVTNRALVRTIAKRLKRPIMLPPVPAPLLRMALGEFSDLVLHGAKVSSKKIESTGFRFKFDRLDSALKEILTSDR